MMGGPTRAWAAAAARGRQACHRELRHWSTQCSALPRPATLAAGNPSGHAGGRGAGKGRSAVGCTSGGGGGAAWQSEPPGPARHSPDVLGSSLSTPCRCWLAAGARRVRLWWARKKPAHGRLSLARPQAALQRPPWSWETAQGGIAAVGHRGLDGSGCPCRRLADERNGRWCSSQLNAGQLQWGRK